MREIDLIVVHCSATRPIAKIDASEIDRWHRERGWLGNGYHFVIPTNGEVQSEQAGHRCRPLDEPGAHVGDCGPGYNKRSLGICLVGGVDKDGDSVDNFTPQQFVALDDLIKALRVLFPKARVLGHRDLIAETGAPPKDCPCFDVQEFLLD